MSYVNTELPAIKYWNVETVYEIFSLMQYLTWWHDFNENIWFNNFWINNFIVIYPFYNKTKCDISYVLCVYVYRVSTSQVCTQQNIQPWGSNVMVSAARCTTRVYRLLHIIRYVVCSLCPMVASPDGSAVWSVVVSTRWWLLVDHCVLRNWDRILVRAVKGLISRAGMVSICPLLWQRDVKLQQTKLCPME